MSTINGSCPPIRSSGTPLNQSTYIAAKTTACGGSSGITNNPKTQSQRIAALQQAMSLSQPRFASYVRWNPLPACPPLPALANSATEPKPSLNTCLPNKNATLT